MGGLPTESIIRRLGLGEAFRDGSKGIVIERRKGVACIDSTRHLIPSLSSKKCPMAKMSPRPGRS